jgi:hypothetical protein
MERDRNEILAAAEEFLLNHRIEVRRFNKIRNPETNKVIRETIEYRVPNRQEIFVAGVEWADTHPHWISVKDEKPPYDESVLLCVKCFDYVIIGELSDEYGRDIYHDDEGSPYRYESITHWMPLPAKPKGGNDER